MKNKRMRVATTLVAAVAAVTMVAPTPAHAFPCNDKFTQEKCQDIQNLICYLFGKCL
ncbi:MAG TPA: hypothetical protein VEV43_02405 [Actinomycetota bacterium]|nr:hypothetical protein [Actinomycetota bacterium]